MDRNLRKLSQKTIDEKKRLPTIIDINTDQNFKYIRDFQINNKRNPKFKNQDNRLTKFTPKYDIQKSNTKNQGEIVIESPVDEDHYLIPYTTTNQ